jgi:uncharacterized ferredoxin-like protein
MLRSRSTEARQDGLDQLPAGVQQAPASSIARARKASGVVGLKCVMCGRGMSAASAWHHGRPYGPKCADRAGLVGLRFVAQQQQPEAVDDRQMALPL